MLHKIIILVVIKRLLIAIKNLWSATKMMICAAVLIVSRDDQVAMDSWNGQGFS
jgi:hypothetical protein